MFGDAPMVFAPGGGAGGGPTGPAGGVLAGTYPNPSLAIDRAVKLTPTAVKTSAYTASTGDLVRADATAGTVPITLPAGAVGLVVVIKKMDASVNTVTFTANGADSIDGVATGTLRLLNEARTLIGVSGGWTVEAGLNTLTSLDARYASLSGGTLTGDLTAPHFVTSTGFVLPAMAPRSRVPAWRQASMIQNFQTGHGWTATGASSNVNDTSLFTRGTQCATVTTSGTGAQSRLRVTGLSAMDLTGKAIRLTFRVDDVTHLNQVLFYVGTSTLANAFSWKVHTHSASGAQMVQTGEWVTITLQWADVNAATGSYAFTNVPSTRAGFTDMQFAVLDDAAGAVTWHLQSVEFVNDSTDTFPNGVISISFDDVWQSLYDYARPKMDSYGYRGTVYAIADQIGVASKLSLPELQQLQGLSGWDIAGHAYTVANHNLTNGYASCTAAVVNDEFRNLKLWMASNGFNSDMFAYPKGRFDMTTDGTPVDQIAAQYWSASRTIVAENSETYFPAMPQRLRAQSSINDGVAIGGTTVANLTATNGLIDTCRASGTWLILCFHELTLTTPTASTQCSQTGFNTVVDYINTRGIPVLPVAEVLRYYS